MLQSIPKPVGRDRDSRIRICKRCGGAFNLWRGSARFCPGCHGDIRKEKQAAHADRRKREGEYPQPERKWWTELRKRKNEAVENACEVCGMKESECKEQFGCGLTRDHVLPVRFIMQNGLGDPHLDINIKLICSSDAGKKTAAEVKLFDGDVLGFLRDLKRWGWDMEELQMVLKHYGFYLDSWNEFFGKRRKHA